MWKSVNSIRGKAKSSKTTNISSLKVGDEIVVGDKEISDTFNSYFVNVGPILSKDLPESKKSFRMALLDCFVVCKIHNASTGIVN